MAAVAVAADGAGAVNALPAALHSNALLFDDTATMVAAAALTQCPCNWPRCSWSLVSCCRSPSIARFVAAFFLE